MSLCRSAAAAAVSVSPCKFAAGNDSVSGCRGELAAECVRWEKFRNKVVTCSCVPPAVCAVLATAAALLAGRWPSWLCVMNGLMASPF